MAAVLGRIVGAAVAYTIALGEGPIEEDEIRVVVAQRLQQSRGTVGKQVGDGGDVSMCGTDGYPEGDCKAGEGLVTA